MARVLELSRIARQFDAPQNRLYALKESFAAKKVPVTDLISGLVSGQGIEFPPDDLASALREAARKARAYRPDPLGQFAARQAISRYYAREKFTLAPRQILLTPGTSLSYLYVFKILAEAGDEILVPTPSYPLFDAIADIAGVKLLPYRLRDGDRWTLDFDSLAHATTPRTKAVILISPHNPTGAVATAEEVTRLAEFARARNLAIISDEVFSPFVYTGTPLARPAATHAPLVFTLNGFSKMLALPGIKLGWIGVTGEKGLVSQSLKALDMISDTFLPVSEITQAAVPALLEKSRAFQKSFGRAMKERRDLAAGILGARPVEGGFLMALPLREGLDEEQTAIRLLEKHRILTHPGYFYDLEGSNLVVSFVAKPAVLRKALRVVQEVTQAHKEIRQRPA